MSMSRTLIERVLELAQASPDSTALAFRKEKLTYGELAKLAQAAAAYMAELGVKRGDRVLYWLSRRTRWGPRSMNWICTGMPAPSFY